MSFDYQRLLSPSTCWVLSIVIFFDKMLTRSLEFASNGNPVQAIPYGVFTPRRADLTPALRTRVSIGSIATLKEMPRWVLSIVATESGARRVLAGLPRGM